MMQKNLSIKYIHVLIQLKQSIVSNSALSMKTVATKDTYYLILEIR